MPSSSRALLLTWVATSYILSKWQQQNFFASLLIVFPLHVIALAIWKVVLYPLIFSPLRHLPEPEGGSWLTGHASLLPDERSGEPMNDWIDRIPNDGLIRYRVSLNRERLFVTSPKALSEVLVQKNYDFAKPRSLRQGLGRILGVGLIVAEGDEHKVRPRPI